MEVQRLQRSAICFLVVNDLSELSRIAIQSCLSRTDAPIFIGIIDERDVSNLPKSNRIHYINLDLLTGDRTSGSSGKYQDFSTDDFYQIVQYKWQLLLKIMAMDFEYIVYSDTDVYWNLNPLPLVAQVFQSRKSVEMQIQNFTDDPSQPKLCMGFVAFRVSPKNVAFLNECAERHRIESLSKKKVGDDDIVTLKFAEDGFPASVLELPSTTFPVGRMLKLYSIHSIMPGLNSPEPYIFHANYVVGLTNKLILIKLFMRNYSSYDRNHKFGFSLYFKLVIIRMRHSLHTLKLRVFAITKSN